MNPHHLPRWCPTGTCMRQTCSQRSHSRHRPFPCRHFRRHEHRCRRSRHQQSPCTYSRHQLFQYKRSRRLYQCKHCLRRCQCTRYYSSKHRCIRCLYQMLSCSSMNVIETFLSGGTLDHCAPATWCTSLQSIHLRQAGFQWASPWISGGKRVGGTGRCLVSVLRYQTSSARTKCSFRARNSATRRGLPKGRRQEGDQPRPQQRRRKGNTRRRQSNRCAPSSAPCRSSSIVASLGSCVPEYFSVTTVQWMPRQQRH
mmetsp:Transcript_19042/g.44359  ORF Transcript_19042/g.44359 Transcript_19042/m.44359 type:complete len:255 (+) Transcript_19042:387-1151(+)